MVKNRIGIVQNIYRDNGNRCHNEYHFWAENGIYLGGLLFPSDGQYLFDDKTLDIITKALAIRWRLIQARQPGKKSG